MLTKQHITVSIIYSFNNTHYAPGSVLGAGGYSNEQNTKIYAACILLREPEYIL